MTEILEPQQMLQIGQGGKLGQGRYEVQRMVGAGTLGYSYLALDHRLAQQRILLKLLYPALLTNPQVRNRVRLELSRIRRLNHPHLVRVFSFGGSAREPYYVTTEYVEGRTLRELITSEQPSLSVNDICGMLYGIGIGLSAIHHFGMVHGALKPENILISQHGEVKLSDAGFGLWRQMLPQTNGQFAYGDPSYTSPELLLGKALSPAADMYSFGVVAYELVTGTLPFCGKSFYELMQAHLHSPIPSMRTKAPHLPRWIEDLVCSCLEKDIGKRPGNADDALSQLLAKGPTAPTPVHISIATLPRVGAEVPTKQFSTARFFRRFFVGALLTLTIYSHFNSSICRRAAVVPLYLERTLQLPMPLFRKLIGFPVDPWEVPASWPTLSDGRAFLWAGYDPNTPNVRGVRYIHHTLLTDGKGRETVLSYGGSPNIPFSNDHTYPLHHAVMIHPDPIIELLLAYGARPDVRDAERRTPLHLAARLNRKEAARMLLRAGADIGAEDKNGRTPLLYAIESEQLEMVQLLLDRGASLLPILKKNEVNLDELSNTQLRELLKSKLAEHPTHSPEQ